MRLPASYLLGHHTNVAVSAAMCGFGFERYKHT